MSLCHVAIPCRVNASAVAATAVFTYNKFCWNKQVARTSVRQDTQACCRDYLSTTAIHGVATPFATGWMGHRMRSAHHYGRTFSQLIPRVRCRSHLSQVRTCQSTDDPCTLSQDRRRVDVKYQFLCAHPLTSTVWTGSGPPFCLQIDSIDITDGAANAASHRRHPCDECPAATYIRNSDPLGEHLYPRGRSRKGNGSI